MRILDRTTLAGVEIGSFNGLAVILSMRGLRRRRRRSDCFLEIRDVVRGRA